MYNQTYENQTITQQLIDSQGVLVSSLNFINCHQIDQHLVIKQDARICRGTLKHVYFGSIRTEDQLPQLVQIWGANIESIECDNYTNLVANCFDDDAPDGKAIQHAECHIDGMIINAKASIHNTAIEHIIVKEYGNVQIDAPIGEGYLKKALVHGTLHLNGTVPCEQIDVAPGGRVRIWNIDHATDVKVRGLVRDCYVKQDENDRSFWYYG